MNASSDDFFFFFRHDRKHSYERLRKNLLLQFVFPLLLDCKQFEKKKKDTFWSSEKAHLILLKISSQQSPVYCLVIVLILIPQLGKILIPQKKKKKLSSPTNLSTSTNIFRIQKINKNKNKLKNKNKNKNKKQKQKQK